MNARPIIRLLIFILAITISAPVVAQQPGEKPAADPGTEEIMPENFTLLLKQAWSFLKSESEKYVSQSESKSEFETKADFDERLASFRRQYHTNVAKYVKDQKLDQRTFVLRFKAQLDKYTVETETYTIRASETLEAPYNIPTVQCSVSPNPFVALADSVRQGYRISSLHLNFRPALTLRMSKDVAASAKSDQDGVFFRIHLQVSLDSSKDPAQSRLVLVPKRILLINTKAAKTYWEQAL
ncbi:MAG: hypothetical protein FJ215_08485 [Ignavibacteria bacterium]|nr:hypothetical protein [Ignavibacteria bacterium]